LAFLPVIAATLALTGLVWRAAPGGLPTPSGRTITPAGTMVSAGDFPAAALLSPAGTLYVADAGETANYLDAYQTPSLAATFTLPTAPASANAAPYTQSGNLALSPDGRTLYDAGGRTGVIRAFSATAAPTQSMTYTVANAYVGGVAVGRNGRYLFATLPFDGSRLYNKGRLLARVDTATGVVVTATVGQHPLAVADGVLRRGEREVMAVANRDDGTVGVLDTATLATIATVAVGRQPAALAFTADGSHLLVVDSLDDELVDVRTASWRVDARLSLSAPNGVGAAPSALAVTRDGGTVYVALSADNAVAVVQRLPVGRTAERPAALRLLGRIPTAVYPTALALDADRRTLYVTAGKGVEGPVGVPPNPGQPVPAMAVPNTGPSGLGVSGVVESVPLPATRAALDAYSAQVAGDNGWNNPAATSGIPGAITHVIYIIRENKTYDEEFGDETGGQITSTVPDAPFYGRPVTPNTHALADRFALLPAYYADEEVSDTGHQVVMGGRANDWVERMAQQAYGLDGAPRPGSELGNGDDILWAPANYLFDDALAHGVGFRDYGEFYRQDQTQDGPAVTPALDSHIVHNFPGFGFNVGVPDTRRVAYWKGGFQQDVISNTFPALEVIYLPEDHTSDGVPDTTAVGQVADSDYATGQIVETLSHSKYWGSTAVFLTEDDPQSGVDHIDEHRTIGLVVSPYVRAGVVTTHYDQAGMLRTVERILGLPPLTEFDATAPPMDALFNQATPDLTPYTAISPTVSLLPLAARAAVGRFALRVLGPRPRFDRIPSAVQRRLQWYSIHGLPAHGAPSLPQPPAWVRDWLRRRHSTVHPRPFTYIWGQFNK